MKQLKLKGWEDAKNAASGECGSTRCFVEQEIIAGKTVVQSE